MKKLLLLFLFFSPISSAMLSKFLSVNDNPNIVIHPWHGHPLYLCNLDNGWTCDNPNPGKCPKGFNEEYKTNESVKRYRCKICDFDLCGFCMNKGLEGEYITKLHEHPFTECFINNGWKCDNKKCLSNITDFHQTGNIKRFRCERCDFDVCENCFTNEKNISYSPLFKDELDQINTTDKCLKCNNNKRDGMMVHENGVGHIAMCYECSKESKECILCYKPGKPVKVYLTSEQQ